MIGSLVSDNTSLRVLELIFDGNDFGVSPSLSLSFFNAIRNASYFESIRVNGFITSDAVMESFYNWITSNQMLNTLKVSIFSNISSVGWQSFASAPSSLDRLEDIEIEYHCEMASSQCIYCKAYFEESLAYIGFVCATPSDCKCAWEPQL